jgi:putative membrane protein
MNASLLVIGSIFVAVAAVIHLAIFVMESVLWGSPKVWRRFGLRSQADADVVRPMAYNQGFYNAFLAIGVGIGLVLASSGQQPAGFALMLFAAFSMLLASLILVSTATSFWRAALIQGAAPLIGVVFLLLGVSG